jgi:hypothetical protein
MQYLLSYAHFAKLMPVTLIPVCLDLKSIEKYHGLMLQLDLSYAELSMDPLPY